MKFLTRYWRIFLCLFLALSLFVSNSLFAFLGPLTFIPALAALSTTIVLIFRNIFHAGTTAAYAENGEYAKDFNSLPSREKVWLTTIQFWVYLLILAILTLAAIG